jgi:hypothetical protein
LVSRSVGLKVGSLANPLIYRSARTKVNSKQAL